MHDYRFYFYLFDAILTFIFLTCTAMLLIKKKKFLWLKLVGHLFVKLLAAIVSTTGSIDSNNERLPCVVAGICLYFFSHAMAGNFAFELSYVALSDKDDYPTVLLGRIPRFLRLCLLLGAIGCSASYIVALCDATSTSRPWLLNIGTIFFCMAWLIILTVSISCIRIISYSSLHIVYLYAIMLLFPIMTSVALAPATARLLDIGIQSAFYLIAYLTMENATGFFFLTAGCVIEFLAKA